MHTSNDTMSKTDRAILGMTAADIERFWSKVDKTPGQGPKGKCWIWIGRRQNKGYGVIKIKRSDVKAHRVSYFLDTGCLPPPDRPLVLHKCDTPLCINPDCLFDGTYADNSADMASKKRQMRGSRNGRAKLTDMMVEEILSRYIPDETGTRQLAGLYGVSRTAVKNIVHGKSWKHITPAVARYRAS